MTFGFGSSFGVHSRPFDATLLAFDARLFSTTSFGGLPLLFTTRMPLFCFRREFCPISDLFNTSVHDSEQSGNSTNIFQFSRTGIFDLYINAEHQKQRLATS
jgi:hypothetical protein